MAREQLITEPEFELQSVMLNSNIGTSREANYVSEILLKYIKECRANLSRPHTDPRAMIIPQLSHLFQGDSVEIPFAEKSLISIGLFKDHFKWLTKFRGNPSYKAYGDKGKEIFFDYGMKDLSSHFYDWADFLQENLTLRPSQEEGIVAPVFYKKVRYHKSFPDNRQWKRPSFLGMN